MRKFPKYALLVFLVLLFSALVIELILGIAFRIKDGSLEPMAVRDYPFLYYIFEDDSMTNEMGIKTTLPLEKQEGKFRIVLTGGSVARGRGNTETISVFLEQELNERLGTDKIEVINAGMSAYVVEQEFIFTQLILQKYNPDMIIGLDGYNDLLSWRINRFTKSPFILPPHNYSQFEVIKDGKYQKTVASRFTGFFKNIGRVVHYYERKNLENQFEWDSIKVTEKVDVSETYWSIVQDTRDFCASKRIDYYSILQPVRFYGRGDDTTQLTREERGMSSVYALMEIETLEKEYATSLAKLFQHRKEVFTDDCHVTVDGNIVIAKSIADFIEPRMADYLNPAEEGDTGPGGMPMEYETEQPEGI